MTSAYIGSCVMKILDAPLWGRSSSAYRLPQRELFPTLLSVAVKRALSVNVQRIIPGSIVILNMKISPLDLIARN